MKNLEETKASFHKYLNNELTEEEAKKFLLHLQSGQDDELFLSLIEENLDGPLAEQLLYRPELTAILDRSFEKITRAIESKKRIVALWPRIAVVAAAIAFIVIGAYFFNESGPKIPSTTKIVNHIKPGTIGATLTLANGKKIRLSDAANGEIANEAGISVTKTADGQLLYVISAEQDENAGVTNVLNTAKGETYRVRLPDGTDVWLNAASSLTYNTNLGSNQLRQVKLDGEAYFQIAEDKERPFIVKTRQQEITVLGTHFNVNAYSNEEEVTTTLLKGSVRIAAAGGLRILKPGDQASVGENSIAVNEVDVERSVAWKQNKFLFENDDIQYIMRMIERWYNIEVVYVGELPKEKFGGGVSRFDDVSKVLRILESTGGARFKIEGQKIVVSK